MTARYRDARLRGAREMWGWQVIGRRRLVGCGVAVGALGVVGVGDALVSRSVARVARPDTGAVDHIAVGGGRGSSVPAFDTAPARAVLKRLLPEHAGQIELLAVAGADDVDRYRVPSPRS